MKQFTNRILVCVIPVLVAGLIVGIATHKYLNGRGGFKLGVDLVGGTILVYQVDPEKKLKEDYKPEELATSLKRRIDPTDLYNVTIRPLSTTRVEIILPTGGAHQARIEEQRWQELLQAVRKEYPETTGASLEAGRGHQDKLVQDIEEAIEKSAWTQFLDEVRKKWPDKLKDVKLEAIPPGKKSDLITKLKEVGVEDKDKEKDITAFVDKAYQTTYEGKLVKREAIDKFIAGHYQKGEKQDVTGEEVNRIKRLIAQVGSLEFRILANERDDKEAIEAARAYIDAASDPKVPEDVRNERKRELDERAARGLPPPPPKSPEGSLLFKWTNQRGDTSEASYSWVELDRDERESLQLNNDNKDSPRWKAVAQARAEGKAIVLGDYNQTLMYSRPAKAGSEAPRKRFEYFFLTRDPKPSEKITGQYLTSATPGQDKQLRPCVNFRFNTDGGNLFHEVTTQNKPSGGETKQFHRHLAIILDDKIVSAPQLNEPIRYEGQISGNFTPKKVDDLVRILRSGALPATLQPEPVSENTIGPTLGEDTIRRGTQAVLWAFIAVLAFMLVYYRFSGVVACVALLANLLLTVGFLVLVNATFTLPGLAGLVLMLGMAVDANVLIYERLREERDRGASLALAIRNGYDRAFPVIIDTHLTSIFNAIVLYAIGNDQLKGFGVTLTVGLIISLFTSLYMTRLMFDIWLSMGWLHKLSMYRLLSKTSIDFMRIRYYWFTATILLTLFGITVFLVRGQQSLNIDFTGGTLYGGRLVKPLDITQLRHLLGEDSQKRELKLADKGVKELDDKGKDFTITYADGDQQHVRLTNPAAGSTREEHEADVRKRAESLPDWSVEQIFTSMETSEGDKSPLFNVRTAEKAPDLVQVSIDRLLRENSVSLLEKIELTKFEIAGRKATLWFNKPASPGQVKTLLERQLQILPPPKDKAAFELTGEGQGVQQRYELMRLDVTGPESDKITEEDLKTILGETKAALAARPQPERLENFDTQYAGDTQARAMYAILASWGAILLYLWFRFGNWTFGLATVLCLMHDLFFTLGIIAFCHYIVHWTPWLASVLMLQDFKIDFTAVAALLTLVGYSVNDTIVVFDRIREVRGKNPELTPQMINDSVNQTLSRTLLTAFSVWEVVIVLYIWGGEGVHLFAFVMVVGVIVGTYSSIYIASPLLLIFGEGRQPQVAGAKRPEPEPEPEAEPEEEEEEEEVTAGATSEQITTKPGSGGDAPEERIKE
jgi:SecD/SecF fusion protein